MKFFKKLYNFILVKFFLKKGMLIKLKSGRIFTEEIYENYSVLYTIERNRLLNGVGITTDKWLKYRYNIDVEFYDKILNNLISISENDLLLLISKPIKRSIFTFIKVLHNNKIYYVETKDIEIINYYK